MILLLTLLSLCATECRVHRNPYTHTDEVGIGCEISNLQLSKPGHIMNFRDPKYDSCVTDSHWLPCTVVEKCDTVYDWHFATKFPEYKNWAYGQYDVTWIDSNITRHYNWTAGLIGYSILCHPETTLVDRGVVDDGWWFSTPDGKIEIRKQAEDDTVWIFDTPFFRSEIPDLKEMLREWRVDKCYQQTISAWKRWDIFKWETDAIRDSCECVYGVGVK